MLTGRSIFLSVGRILNDEDFVRWTLPELAGWLNEGIKALIAAKPSASTKSIVVSLKRGTLQQVPQDGSPKPLRILSVPRNLESATDRSLGGRAIIVTDRRLLDAQMPNWHNTKYAPFRKEVRQYTFDEENPLEFYCYPGNDGNGLVEAVVSVLPDAVIASGDEAQLSSYDSTIGLPEIYEPALVDYICHRAQLKDDTEANTGRAGVHYQTFATAVGLKIQVERATSPNRERS